MSLRLTGRDDPNHFLFFVLNRMHDQQKQHSLSHPDRLPPLLPIHISILRLKMQPIAKDERSRIEADAMLPKIAGVLLVVPLKPQAHRLYTFVYTSQSPKAMPPTRHPHSRILIQLPAPRKREPMSDQNIIATAAPLEHDDHKGPHDPKEINPKMASDIAYWSKEFGVTGQILHEAIRVHGTHVDKVRAALANHQVSLT